MKGALPAIALTFLLSGSLLLAQPVPVQEYMMKRSLMRRGALGNA